jgi:hypothetical protein
LRELAATLEQHTSLHTFLWYDHCRWNDTHLDRVLEALVTGHRLQRVSITSRCANAEAIANLLESVIDELQLALSMDAQWATVANRMSEGRCSVRSLHLLSIHVFNGNDDETLADIHAGIHAGAVLAANLRVGALSAAIGVGINPNLEDLELRFDTEQSISGAVGEALAVALTNNQTLHTFSLLDARLWRSNLIGTFVPCSAPIPISFYRLLH